MANSDEYYMRKALEEAKVAYEKGEIPIGAIVVCHDRIIARCFNLTETLADVTAHAEMQAITAAANTLGGKYLNECTLYVTVEPCGAYDDKKGYHLLAPNVLHPKTIVVGGILAEESATLMKSFFQERR